MYLDNLIIFLTGAAALLATLGGVFAIGDLVRCTFRSRAAFHAADLIFVAVITLGSCICCGFLWWLFFLVLGGVTS